MKQQETSCLKNSALRLQCHCYTILEKLQEACDKSQFTAAPWKLVDEDNSTPAQPQLQLVNPIQTQNNVQNVTVPTNIINMEELKANFPHDLLGRDSNEKIKNHPCFKGIFGREAHIRNCLRSIWSFLEAGGERNNHILLYGAPGCAKSHMLLAFEKLFGNGAVLRLNSDSTSKAGIEKLFFKDLQNLPVPPLVFIEEIEKTNEEALHVWLSAMDDRHEIRKVNFHVNQVRKVYVLVIATANNKQKLDMMMGGRVDDPGPLSSRFKHEFECTRPSVDEMRRILIRDINEKGGKLEWVDPVMKLAEQLRTDDPRKILAFLDGGDDLLNGFYQQDMMTTWRKNQ